METKRTNEEEIFVSRLPDIDIPDVSVGQYCYEKVKQYEEKVLLVSYFLQFDHFNDN